jgi:hypothetical protein
MTLLQFDWIATAAAAVITGLAGPKSWKRALMFCAIVALVGWAASYMLMAASPRFGGDTALAENYINGFSVLSAIVEIVVALAWTLLWFGAARVTLLISRRGRQSGI